jgi:Zn-dependent membrane protease YugP
MFFDPLWLLISLPGLVLSLWASHQVKSTFRRFSQVGSRSGYSGAEAASELLRRNGIRGVRIEPARGFLSDHYDPAERTLRLSPDVFQGRSLAALGVAAHEAGHAIQHAHGYAPLKFRSLVVKPAAVGSNLGVIVASLGLVTQASGLIWAGIALFSAFVLFTLMTLPVEFNASRRAVAALQQTGIITSTEVGGTWAVLRAAALTYVAAAVTAILQLLYFLFRAGFIGGSDD